MEKIHQYCFIIRKSSYPYPRYFDVSGEKIRGAFEEIKRTLRKDGFYFVKRNIGVEFEDSMPGSLRVTLDTKQMANTFAEKAGLDKPFSKP